MPVGAGVGVDVGSGDGVGSGVSVGSGDSVGMGVSVISGVLVGFDVCAASGVLVGFGGFETKKREARMGRNPKTKEAIEIPATTIPVFKAGKALKEKTAK